MKEFSKQISEIETMSGAETDINATRKTKSQVLNDKNMTS